MQAFMYVSVCKQVECILCVADHKACKNQIPVLLCKRLMDLIDHH